MQAEASCGSRPSLVTLCTLVRACIARGEARRAHRWMQALVETGSSDHQSYMPAFVKKERKRLRTLRRWDVDDYLNVVMELIKALVEHDNSFTANGWLRYLSSCGLKYEQAPEVWECVRSVHPQDITPTVLSGECEAIGLPQSPPYMKPATLNGERRTDLVLQAKEYVKPSQDRPLSQVSTRTGVSPGPPTRPDTSSCLSNGRWSQLSWPRCHSAAGGSRPITSPTLRRLLEARTRGATATLSGVGGVSTPRDLVASARMPSSAAVA